MFPHFSLCTFDHQKNDLRELSNTLDDGSNIDFSIWQVTVDSPPPPKDENCLIALSRIQQRISNHVPIDNDHDWLDVEIDLPDIQEGRSRKNAFNEDMFSIIYSLFSYGNSNGFVLL